MEKVFARDWFSSPLSVCSSPHLAKPFSVICNNMRALYILIFVIFTLNSCKKNEVKLQEIEFKNFKDWWTYYTKEIKLSKDFIALNSKNNEISKKQFLDSLNTGEYLPIKLKKENETYFLQKNKTNDVSIISTIKQVAETQLFNLSWEGKKFPKFNFTDLSGNNYTSENTKSKILFLKTYYINCQACNEEMPQLNKFIAENRDPNFIYLSLALDDEKKLKNYLANKNYEYQFVPDQKEFIENKLQTNIFPTHFVIENGIVKKVVNESSELIDFAKNK